MNAWPFAITPQQLGLPGASRAAEGLWRLDRPQGAAPGRADVWLLSLGSAAWPDPARPGAAACVPPNFDPGAPLHVVLYLHGHNGCVATAVGDVAAPCSPGGKARNPSRLAAQLGDARVNAILLAPELKADAATGACGALGRPGGFRALLDEALGLLLPALGGPPGSAARVASVLAMAHSGGYVALAAACRQDLPALRHVALLDALYGEWSTFERWAVDRKADLGPGPDGARFSCFYTDHGGTDGNARELARALGRRLPRGLVRVVDTRSTLTEEEYRSPPVLFKRSSLDHGGVSRYYPRHIIAAAGFPALRQ